MWKSERKAAEKGLKEITLGKCPSAQLSFHAVGHHFSVRSGTRKGRNGPTCLPFEAQDGFRRFLSAVISFQEEGGIFSSKSESVRKCHPLSSL